MPGLGCLHDFHGSDRERITAEDLLKRFEDLRRREQLGGSTSEFLRSAKGATELLAIFEAIAAVDEHIDAREIALIEEFATCWNLPMPNLTEGATEASGDILTLRTCVSNYLQISPPAEQATELLDVLYHFVHADETVSKEEEMVLEEITSMIMGYVTQSGDQGEHEVVIVPQTEEQKAAVLSILPSAEASNLRGGIVYSVGRFYSARYAEMVCDKYVALGLFTTRVEVKR